MKTFWFIKLDQFSTYVREYLGLKHLEFSPYCDFIMNPNSKSIQPSVSLRNYFNPKSYEHLNHSQVEAIFGVLESKSMITLIHGPPGTGKTQTIVGLLDLIHKLDRNPDILLCAPSNGAIDELAFRIMDKW